MSASSPEPGGPMIPVTDEQRASLQILVIDDDDTLCESCVSLLRQDGYKVRGVTGGEEAETAVRAGTWDIVVLDLYMSGVPGAKLLALALEARPDSIVIVMTGKPSVESSLQALMDGASDYIAKPFAAAHLQVVVGRAAHTFVVSRDASMKVYLDSDARGRLGELLDEAWSAGEVRIKRDDGREFALRPVHRPASPGGGSGRSPGGHHLG